MKCMYVLVFALVVLLVIGGCTQTGGTTQGTAAASTSVATTAAPAATAATTTTSVNDNTIDIRDMAFTPATITVPAGAIVRWVNRDSIPHSVVFSKESKIATSGALSGGQSFSVKFPTAGTYAYSCGIHPAMTGTVIVE
ncbi:MAG: cupredoxin family copper-binding protein [Methanoregula sp.]|nr:cupredoxin family copper-binding protein [Methanoregula sp.]